MDEFGGVRWWVFVWVVFVVGGDLLKENIYCVEGYEISLVGKGGGDEDG